MANVSVFNMEGKEVGTLELNDAVFGVEVNEHLVHLAVVAQLANKRRKKAMAAEGNRSCKTGFNQSAAVDRRRRSVRAYPKRLHHPSEQEGEESSIKVCTFQPCSGEQVHRC